MESAISILMEGINEFGPRFPGRYGTGYGTGCGTGFGSGYKAGGIPSRGSECVCYPPSSSAEVGELHNQAAIMLFLQGKVDEAAHHAEVS